MLVVEIPGYGTLALEHLVLDVNGTLAVDGAPVSSALQLVAALGDVLHVWAITADNYGTAELLGESFAVDMRVITPGGEGEQKLEFVDELGASSVVAIGNGANDALMLQAAELGIAVIGEEGLARSAADAADILTRSIEDALGLLVYPRRLVATLRR